MNAGKSSDHLELVTLAASGDAGARHELLERLKGRVRAIALSILGNAPDADDAVQSIMIEILSSANGYRGDNLLAWSDRIAVRTAMRQAKKRRMRAAQAEPDAEIEDVPASPTAPPDFDIPRPIVEYLEALPEARRVALVLHHVMDYSVHEIAELTESSPNTVKDRLLHARRQMRKLIRRDLAFVLGRGRGG